ncbi:TPD1 protein homolog 1-like [Nymphaea colorata]|nr:TPD1 protein homolog 1-like [Nymphaea colorata]
MAATLAPSSSKLLAAFLILYIVAHASGKLCDKSSVNVSYERTGTVVEGQPEWEVVVRNTCGCSLSHVQLTCTGFSTVKEVDPRLFRSLAKDQDHCLVNDGKPIAPSSTVRFSYAWLTPYDLPFFSAQPRCT